MFYPETGVWANDVKNKVYFDAWSNSYLSENVDFTKGKLIEISTTGSEVVVYNDIATTHRGKGSFVFTPSSEATYYLEVSLGGSNGV